MAPPHSDPKRTQQLSADEELARRLQAEFDAAGNDETSSRYQSSHGGGRNYDSAASSSKGKGRETNGQAKAAPPTSKLAMRPKTQADRADRVDRAATTVEGDIALLQEHYATMASKRCHKCQTAIARDFDPKRHLGNWTDAVAASGGSSVCAVVCVKPGCGASTCLGCGRKPTVGTNVAETGDLDWCCDKGRFCAIWVLLARYDQVELKMQEQESKKAAERAEAAAAAAAAAAATQAGYGYPGHGYGYPGRRHQDLVKGKGYVSNREFDNIQALLDERSMYGMKSVRPINFECADRLTDAVLGQLMGLIAALLPSSARSPSSQFDTSPPPVLNATLRLSLLMDKIAELLRNDSIADVSKRTHVYFPALDFINTLGGHSATADLVTKARYYKRGTAGLQVLSSSGGSGNSKGKGRAVSEELVELGTAEDGEAPALITRLENLATQSEIMLGLGGAKEARQEFRSEADKATFELCQRVVRVHTKIGPKKKSTALAGKAKPAKGLPDASSKAAAWLDFHKKNCFELTVAVMTRHRWAEDVRSMQSPKGRIPYLMKELASMATSLPDGIFVKASADTPGVLKALVVGPEDTPYENGLFEFDIAAGPSYPTEPPMVYFTGTHGHYADMNPNLHRDGKVCLSLLGTFDGPAESKWQARKSTILSVLVSIQGMILTDEPWRNEPGNGGAADPVALAHCRQYGLDRMALTLRFAVLPWLLDESWRAGRVWRHVVESHFRLRGHSILATARSWAAVSPGVTCFREPQSPREAVVTFAGPGRGRDLLALLERAMREF